MRKQGNKVLNNVQELVLKLFLDYIDRIRFDICSKIVQNVANLILA
jgi:hypothetical protein